MHGYSISPFPLAGVELPRWHRQLLVWGSVLVVLGIFHVPVQMMDPRPWDSPVGWRKPILFGISTGLKLISISWVVGALFPSPPRHLRWLAWGAVAEVFLITVQTWRGIPSHFATGSGVDRWIAYLIEGLLVVMTASLLTLTYHVLRFRSAAAGSMLDFLRAAQWGLGLLLLGCAIGFVIAIRGHLVTASGGDPYVIPPAGIPKFPHGMPLHALQILPLWVGFCRWLNWGTVASRTRSVHWAAMAILLATVYAIEQTWAGEPRQEPTASGWVYLGLTLIAAVIGWVSAVKRGG